MNGDISAPSMNPSTDQALAGRLPVAPSGRVFASYHTILLTFTAISAASYSYLVGTSLIAIGNTRIGILGYLVGLVLGIAFVSLAGGAVSFRYGVDTVDAGKASLGMRGSVVLLFGVLVCTLGWADVLLAMTARATVRLADALAAHPDPISETSVAVVGLTFVFAIWVVLKRGVRSLEKVSNYCAAIQLVVAFTLFAFIAIRHGINKAFLTNASPGHALSLNPVTQMAYAVEFGICNALGMLPYMGGLSRLVKRSTLLVGPPILGYAVFGAAFIAAIGALATNITGDSDPSVWILRIAGPYVGLGLLGAMLVANLGAMVAQVYLAAIAIQQFKGVARFPWRVIVAAVLIPGVIISFFTQWAIDHVMNWLVYNGVMFVGLASVMFVDFFILRRERVAIAQLFAAHPGRHYWFWGGVNWIAIAVVSGSIVMYLWLFDPISLRVSSGFPYAGATLPTVLVSSCAYYGLMKWMIWRSSTIGGYRASARPEDVVEVSI